MYNKLDLGALGSIELLDVKGSDIDCANAARVSFGKRKTELEESDIKLINYLVKHEHMSPFEHNQITFLIKCPKPINVQWLRHRTWSYNEISGRYVEFDEDLYTPDEFRQQSKNNRQASQEAKDLDQASAKSIYKLGMNTAFDSYKKLLEMGVAREQARMVLPFGFMTEFYATVNLRNFIHWYKLRDHEGAQYEIRQFAKAALQLVEPHFPHTIKAFKEDASAKHD
jgi:thymidylate synthase (FAD)